MFEGIIDGDKTEVIYVGKTDKKNVKIGKRIKEQYNDTGNSTIRKNAVSDGFTIITDHEEYIRVLDSKSKGENTVFITSISVWLFGTKNEDFAARGSLEMLLIAKETPRFNKEFMHLSDVEKKLYQMKFLEKETNQFGLSEQDKFFMSEKSFYQNENNK